MKVVEGEECVDTRTFRYWAAFIRDGKLEQVSLNLSDKKWRGRPQIANVDDKRICFDEVIKELADKTSISR
jgi:hypothetical protein